MSTVKDIREEYIKEEGLDIGGEMLFFAPYANGYSTWLESRLSTVEAEREKAFRAIELKDRALLRYLPCPDHRDKVNGECWRCRCETAEKQAREYAEFITTEMGVAFVEKYRAVCRSCRAELTISLLNHFLPQDHDEGCMYLKCQSYFAKKGESHA